MPKTFDTILKLLENKLKDFTETETAFTGYVVGQTNCSAVIKDIESLSNIRYVTRQSSARVKANGEPARRRMTGNDGTGGRYFWSLVTKLQSIPDKGVPFKIESTHQYDCPFGPKKCRKRNEQQVSLDGHLVNTTSQPQRKRMKLDIKKGCQASIHVKTITTYPTFAIETTKEMIPKQIIDLKKQKMIELREQLATDSNIAREYLYYLSFPKFHNDHALGKACGLYQRIDPLILRKIQEYVSQEITSSARICALLREMVHFHFQEKTIKPDESNRQWYPTEEDVRKYVTYLLSKTDEQNLEEYVTKRLKSDPDCNIFFRYSKEKKGPSNPLHQNHLLFVQQEKWQRELFLQYGDDITILDATFKSVKLNLPLYFLYVLTNVGYMPVGVIIVQEETVEHLAEALSIIHSWHSKAWSPKYFMTDFDETEIGAIAKVFQEMGTKVYFSAYHKETAWKQWIKTNLQDKQGSSLLQHLRDIANAETLPLFNERVQALRSSHVYQQSYVQKYVENSWLCCADSWCALYRVNDFDVMMTKDHDSEVINKAFKYDVAKDNKDRSNHNLMTLVKTINNKFLPEQYRQFIKMNAEMTGDFHVQDPSIPEYLQQRPDHFIQHCMAGLSDAKKMTDRIYEHNNDHLTYRVLSSGDQQREYIVCIKEPNCECVDWLVTKLPCKHMFTVFQQIDGIDFNSLPESYRQRPYIKPYVSR